MKGKLIIQPMGGLANRMRVIGKLRMVANLAHVPIEVLWVSNNDVGAKWGEIFEQPKDFSVMEVSGGHTSMSIIQLSGTKTLFIMYGHG